MPRKPKPAPRKARTRIVEDPVPDDDIQEAIAAEPDPIPEPVPEPEPVAAEEPDPPAPVPEPDPEPSGPTTFRARLANGGPRTVTASYPVALDGGDLRYARIMLPPRSRSSEITVLDGYDIKLPPRVTLERD